MKKNKFEDKENPHRVIELKLSGKSKEFQESWDRTFEATRHLFNDMAFWGNDFVYTKTSTNTKEGFVFDQVDLKPKRHMLYLSTDRSIPEAQFDRMLKVFYTQFVNKSQARDCANPLLGTITKNEPLSAEEVEWLWDEKKWKDIDMAHLGVAFRDMGVRRASAWGQVDLSACEKFSVAGNVHRMLTSWAAQNAETKENYTKEESEIAAKLGEIPQAARPGLTAFLKLCIENDYIRWFDWKSTSYLKDCVIPAVKEGKAPQEQFCLDAKGGKQPYSLHTGLIDYILNHPSLVEGETLISALPILELMTSHEAHRPAAAFPFIGEADLHRFQYLLGTNYVKYSLHGNSVADLEDQQLTDKEGKVTIYQKGTKPDRVSLQIAHQSSERVAKKAQPTIQFEIHTKDRYHNGSVNPGQYFTNLSFWNSKETYLLRWIRKGLGVTALLKEPAVVRRGGSYFVRLNLTIKLGKLNQDLLWTLNSAAPAAKDERSVLQEEAKNVDRLSRLRGTTHRIMGVDLGLKSPFAYHVAEIKIVDNGIDNQFTQIESGDILTPENQGYQRLIHAATNTRSIIGMVKYAKEPNAFALKLIEDAKEFFAAYRSPLGERKVQIIQEFVDDADPIATMRKALENETINIVKKSPRFLPNVLYRYCEILFGRINEERRLHYKNGGTALTKWNQEYRYLKAVEEMKRTARSLSYLGTDNTRTPIQTIQFNNRYVNAKDNFLKQIASQVVQKAHDTGCKVIVLERLDAKKGSREQNALVSLWSPAQIKEKIENAADWYGIGVAEVSEHLTSQTHHESRRLGWRDGSVLHCEVEGKLIEVDADQNAAKNIAFRWTRRHTDLNQFYISKGKKKDKKEDGEEDGKKRKLGAMTHAFGSVNKGSETLNSEGYWYKDGSEWIEGSEWTSRKAALKKRVSANRK